MPKHIKARFIQVEIRVRGKYQRVWLVTSLLDADAYPAAEMAELYGRRWRIETMFRRFKVDMDSDLLRSKSPDAVYKEVAARICALNIVSTIMLEAATANNVDVLRISFVDAVRTIIAFAPHLAVRPPEQLPAIYKRMLVEIAERQVPYRPNRSEPRKLKFCKPHYPPLRTTLATSSPSSPLYLASCGLSLAPNSGPRPSLSHLAHTARPDYLAKKSAPKTLQNRSKTAKNRSKARKNCKKLLKNTP